MSSQVFVKQKSVNTAPFRRIGPINIDNTGLECKRPKCETTIMEYRCSLLDGGPALSRACRQPACVQCSWLGLARATGRPPARLASFTRRVNKHYLHPARASAAIEDWTDRAALVLGEAEIPLRRLCDKVRDKFPTKSRTCRRLCRRLSPRGSFSESRRNGICA